MAGAKASAHVPESTLLACFAALMLVVAVVMAVRLVRGEEDHDRRGTLDDPIIIFSPTFACRCPRVLKVLITASVVGLLTGFLGVGGGFLVVPALLLALALPMQYAAGTSLVVITMTSAVALVVRAGSGVSPDWWLVLVLTAASVIAAVAGTRLAGSIEARRLQLAFTALVLGVAVYTAARAFPALV